MGNSKLLLDMFAGAVGQIPGRVVLILDTCEELAKMKADGSPQGAVEVTFKVLAQLHAKVKSLRVVFCGRRPLASVGAGWKCLRDVDKSLPTQAVPAAARDSELYRRRGAALPDGAGGGPGRTGEADSAALRGEELRAAVFHLEDRPCTTL